MSHPRRRRIFLGLTEIAGFYRNLQAGFSELGVPSSFLDLDRHSFRYGGSVDVPRWVEHMTGPGRRRRSTPRRRLPAKLFWTLLDLPARGILLAWALVRFDVFIFGFATHFLSPAELQLFRLLRKQTVFVFHGSDARPPYLDGSLMARDRGRTIDDCITLTAKTKAHITKIDRWANVTVSHGPYGHFHSRPFVAFLELGIPTLTSSGVHRLLEGTPSDGRALRILHAPSHPEAKGSAQIREAVADLQARGLSIDLVEVSGRPNAEVLAALATADFVVDQVYSDTPLAGFAAEAAQFACPAIVCGYDLAQIISEVSESARPPSLRGQPSDLAMLIRSLATDERARQAMGRAARDFVSARWAPAEVARRYLQVIDGQAPTEWLQDPAAIRYIHGAGMSELRMAEIVSGVVSLGGLPALQLEDKPGTARAFAKVTTAPATDET